MDFVNETPFYADMIRTAMSTDFEGPFLVVVVLKVTYEVGDDGKVRIAEKQVPLQYEEKKTDLGVLPGDFACQKPLVDFMILGRAYAHGGDPTEQMTVRLKVGKFERKLLVFGDRKWIKKENGLVPSDPEPFTTMPVSYDNAYGGVAKALGYDIPHPYNPDGKGYVLEEKYAEGLSLPNIEDPEDLITSWDCRPIPAGFAPVPVASMFTVDRGVEIDGERMQQQIRPEIFQCAHPKLTFPEISPGSEVLVEGMTDNGLLRFSLPRLQAEINVQLGEKKYSNPGRIDTVCLFTEEKKFFLLYRNAFKYKFVPEQKRKTILKLVSDGVEGL